MEYVVVESGHTVGRGSLAQQLHGQPLQAGRAFVHVDVDMGHRRRGVGSHLLERLLASAWSEGFRQVAASVAAGDEDSLRFARNRGFRIDYEMVEGELDLRTFDWSPWDAVPPVAARLTSLIESPPHTAALLYELDRELSADVPQWEGLMPPFEEFRAGLEQSPDGVFIAWDGDRPVGYMHSSAEGDGTGYTHFMGVLRACRGRGIALALKLMTIHWAQARGLTSLRTHNNALSTSIIELNRKLGYQLRPGSIYLLRDR